VAALYQEPWTSTAGVEALMGTAERDSRGVTPRRTTLRRLATEVAVIVAAVLVYFGVRGETSVDPARAHDHAQRLVELEIWLGLNVEHAIQNVVSASQGAVMVMNWVYIWGHWPVIAGVLLWLFVNRPDGYREIRAAMILSGAVGLVIFAGFPVAPPRLADPDIVDTVSEYSTSYRVLQPPALVNQYAAMPSLPGGWDLLMGVALITYARRRWMRLLGVLLPVAMLVSVVSTGNHYLVDALAGAGLVTVSLLVVRAVRRRRRGSATADGFPAQRQASGHVRDTEQADRR
jgi:hypothetical protein